MCTHIESGKCYVGSALDLSKRLKNYFNVCYLKIEIRVSKSLIYRALLKYGYNNFKLEILEYCEKINLYVENNIIWIQLILSIIY